MNSDDEHRHHSRNKEFYLFVFFISVFSGGYLFYLLGFNLLSFLLNMLGALVGCILVMREYVLTMRQWSRTKK